MNLNLTLPVIWYNNEGQKLKEAGMEDQMVDNLHTTIKMMVFYQISFVYAIDDSNDTMVGSNGDMYIVKMRPETVQQKIKDQMVFKFN